MMASQASRVQRVQSRSVGHHPTALANDRLRSEGGHFDPTFVQRPLTRGARSSVSDAHYVPISESSLYEPNLVLEAITRLDQKMDRLITLSSCRREVVPVGAADGRDADPAGQGCARYEGAAAGPLVLHQLVKPDPTVTFPPEKAMVQVATGGFCTDSDSNEDSSNRGASGHERAWLAPRSLGSAVHNVTGSTHVWQVLEGDDDSEFVVHKRTRFVRHLTCKRAVVLFKRYFDVIGMILLIIDVIMVPFGLAWEDGAGKQSSTILSLVSVAFWSLDMILSPLMPYEQDGVTISDCRMTTWRYVKGTLLLDSIVNSIEWISVILSQTGESTNSPKSLFKIVRFLKLIRMLRAFQRMSGDRYKDSIDSLRRQAVVYGLEGLFTLLTGTGRYFVFFMWLNHVGSCVWYYLLRTEDANLERAWSFEQRIESGEQLVGENPAMVGWWYLSGVYFTAVSLVSCSSPMAPHSVNEMILALSLHLFGWVFGSLLISTVAAWLVDMKVKAFQRRNMTDTLRGYLKQHKVSPLLAYALQRQVVQRMGARRHICQDTVKALQIVSPALLRSLAFQVHRKNLASEDLLGALQRTDRAFLKVVCSSDGVFEANQAEPGQVLFLPGEECEKALFMLEGEVTYTRDSRMSTSSDTVSGQGTEGLVHVRAGEWIAEACLWVDWRTQGAAEMASHGEVFALRAVAIWSVLLDFPQLANLAVAYSKALADVFRSTAASGCLSDVNSLGCSGKASHVLCRLPSDYRLVMSLNVLENMKASHKWKSYHTLLRELEQEIRDSKSVLLLVNKEPERVVFLSVVELRYRDKRLAEVGYIGEHGEFKDVVPVLPATKLKGDESIENAARRVVEQFMRIDFSLARGSEIIEKTTSARFAVTTSYHKQTFTAELPRDSASSWASVFGYGVMDGQKKSLPLLVDSRAAPQSSRSVYRKRAVFAWLEESRWNALRGGKPLTFLMKQESEEASASSESLGDAPSEDFDGAADLSRAMC